MNISTRTFTDNHTVGGLFFLIGWCAGPHANAPFRSSSGRSHPGQSDLESLLHPLPGLAEDEGWLGVGGGQLRVAVHQVLPLKDGQVVVLLGARHVLTEGEKGVIIEGIMWLILSIYLPFKGCIEL